MRGSKAERIFGWWLAVAVLVLNTSLPLPSFAQQLPPQAPGTRRPGTLLLTILIKNEAEHLKRTLPIWATLADYWIIGVGECPVRMVE